MPDQNPAPSPGDPTRALLERLGVRLPVLQGGMTFGSDGRLVAAVSAAGGLGTLGTFHYRTWDEVARELDLIRGATEAPFAVNLPFFEKGKEYLQAAAEAGVRCFTLGGWCDADAAALKREHGLTLLVSVNNPTVARMAMEKAPGAVDVLIAQGNESGGANAGYTTRQLVETLLAEYDVPVVAAGGLWDGWDLFAMRALGCAGIQLGTRFLFCEESPLHPSIKALVVDHARRRAPVTQLVPVGDVLQMRFLVNKPFKQALRAGELPEIFSDKERVFDLSASFFEEQARSVLMYAGTGIGKLRELEPAARILAAVVSQHDRLAADPPAALA